MSVTERPRALPGPLAPEPVPPVRQYSFTDWQVNNPTSPPPGDRMDAEYDRANTAISQTLSWVEVSLNTDGTLKAGSVGQSQMVSGLFDDIAQDIIDEVQPLVDQAASYASAAAGSSSTAQAAATAADHANTAASGSASTATTAANTAVAARNTAQTYASTAQTAATNADNSDNDAQGAAALAQDYADVTEAWAEHMPDTIPPNILAVMGITGDHWSARWWANEAANTFGGRQLMQSLLYRAAADQTVFPLTTPDLGGKTYAVYSTEPVDVFVNGVKLPADDPNPGNGDWTFNAVTSTVTFLTPLLAGSMVQVDVMSPYMTAPPGVYLPLSGGTVDGFLFLDHQNSQTTLPTQSSPFLVRYTNVDTPGPLPPNNLTVAPVNVIALDYPGMITNIWGINVSMTLSSEQFGINGPWPQHVGGSFTVSKVAGGNMFMAGIHITSRETNNRPSSLNAALLGMEIAHQAAGDDDAGFPSSPGSRLGIHMSQFAWSGTPTWTANTVYAVGAVVNPTGTAAVFTFICTVAGTSGASPPTWPTSAGTVTDGSVTWSFNGYSCVLAMGYCVDGGADAITKSLFGVLGANTYQVFDARTAVAPANYTDPVAALRMSQGQIIDFNGAPTTTKAGWIGPAGSYLQYVVASPSRLRWMSGRIGLTPVTELMAINDLGQLALHVPVNSTTGLPPALPYLPSIVLDIEQSITFARNNNRTLSYTQTGGPSRLAYKSYAGAAATELFSIADNGAVRLVTPINAANDAAAASAGVLVGGVYRNGSVLMVRVA